jgi:hypothetical protein
VAEEDKLECFGMMLTRNFQDFMEDCFVPGLTAPDKI